MSAFTEPRSPKPLDDDEKDDIIQRIHKIFHLYKGHLEIDGYEN
jgi:hypothetical protein